MDRGIMTWLGLVEMRFAGLFSSDAYTVENRRMIDLSKI